MMGEGCDTRGHGGGGAVHAYGDAALHGSLGVATVSAPGSTQW